MIIDAMDILYTGKADGYVLVSSDSDFTPLAIRLRESGMYVIGIGEEKTPKAFVQACDKFIRVEVIRDKYKKTAKPAAKKAPAKKTASKTPEKAEKAPAKSAAKKSAPAASEKPPVPEDIISLIADSVADLADDDGWIDMSNLATSLSRSSPTSTRAPTASASSAICSRTSTASSCRYARRPTRTSAPCTCATWRPERRRENPPSGMDGGFIMSGVFIR